MIYTLCVIAGLFAGAAAAPVADEAAPVSEHEARGRELFPMLVGTKCARFCDARAGIKGPAMSEGADRIVVKGPVKALEMLALNDDLNTLVQSDSMCTRRSAMASGLSLAAVNAPGFAAETKMVKMGSD